MAEQRISNQNEINLTPYVKKVLAGIQKVSTKTSSWIDAAFKRPKIVIASVLFGLIAMTSLFYVSIPVYKTDLVIYSNYFNNDYCAEMIGVLEKLAEEDNSVMLAEKLNLSEDFARHIESVSFQNFNPKFKKIFKDSIAEGVPFRIEVLVSENKILDSLQQGLISYLENNEYAFIRKQITERNLLVLNDKLKSEQLKLDSLKIVIAQSIIPRGSGNGIIYGEPLNPVDIYREAISLFEKELNIYQQLTLLKNIELIQGFTKYNKPYRPKLWINLLIGFALGLFLGVTVAYFIEKNHQNQVKLN
jgi:hypothetical protein